MSEETGKAPRATGGCLCRGVQFEVLGPLRDVMMCHCGQCRRTHGHVAAYTSAARADVVFGAEATLRWYVSSDRARRGFCGTCGASLFWEPEGEGRIAISAGCLDRPTGLRAIAHVYVDDASDYYEIADGLPRYPASQSRP
ncbi:MAG: GFA family protein [Kiloniellales bacterium]